MNSKLKKIEIILNWYDKSLKLDENTFCSTYTAFEIISDLWNELKPAEKKNIVNIMFE